MPRDPAVPTTLPELRGTVLDGRYELGRVLGTGGMGAVFEARDLRLGRPVAVKVIRPALARDGEYIRRFLREARAASKIRHRNVVMVLDSGETASGVVYSVMELFVGRDLEQLLHEQPGQRLPWTRTREMLVQIASGLNAAHGQGVIHRDIKPANCFVIEEDGEPMLKLVDFGIAKLEDTTQTEQLTIPGDMLGTPSYVAPELVRTRQPATPRSDVYSLGVVAYRMLTGSLPFKGETPFEVMRRACMDPVPSLREQVPELPAAFEALVLAMLAKEPDERPADALQVRQRLSALGRESPEMAPMEVRPLEGPPPAEETLPSIGEATVPQVGSASLEPRRRARAKWLATGVLIVGTAVAGVTWSSLGDRMDAANEGPVVGDEQVAAAPAPASADTPVPVTTPAPEEPTAAPVDPAPATSEAVEPSATAAVEIDGKNHDVPKTEASPVGPRRGRGRTSKPPTEPSSDEEIRKRLERKIETNCADEMAGERVTVSFFVTTSGGIQSMTATPKNKAGECGKQQVMGTKFPPRDEDTPIKLVVE